MPSKFAFQLIFSQVLTGRKSRQRLLRSPEESGRIVTHENVYFANGNYERRSSKIADENASC